MAITSFIPELWNARLLFNLEKSHVATNVVNRNYEGQITQAGDTVHIGSIGDVSISDYTKNTDISDPETLATTDQTLVINQAKYFNFQVDDVDKAQAAGDLIDTAMSRASYGLADAADAHIFGLIAAGGSSSNYVGTSGAPIALTAANIYENLVKLRTKLDKQNVPTIGRSVVVPPEAYALLLNDTTHFAVVQPATGESAIINGLVGRIAGFDVYMSNNCVYTDPYWVICAQTADATTYAEQILETKAYSPEKRFGDAVKGLHVYGAKVTRPLEIATLFATIA